MLVQGVRTQCDALALKGGEGQLHVQIRAHVDVKAVQEREMQQKWSNAQGANEA